VSKKKAGGAGGEGKAGSQTIAIRPPLTLHNHQSNHSGMIPNETADL